MDFHGYLQWLAAEQLGAVRQLARELSLERRHLRRLRRGRECVGLGDLVRSVAVLHGRRHRRAARSASASADRSGAFRRRIRAQLRRTAYAPFVALVRASMRNCGALRLDHVMALFRQWWVPRGFKSADGGYVHYPLEDLLGVVALESHRNECLVVGEDLGVVPDEIRRALPQFGVYHYKVVMFEQKNGEFVAPADYMRHALATVTTHDLPTLHGWWSGHDIDLWEKLGLLCRRRRSAERARARARRRNASGCCARCGARNCGPSETAPVPEYSAELARAVHVYLARSPSGAGHRAARGHDRHARARERSRHQQRIFQLDAAHDGERARDLRARRRARAGRRHVARPRRMSAHECRCCNR